MTAKYELKQTPRGKFMFNLKSANGKVVITSQLYNDKSAAKNGIKSVMKNGAGKKNFEKRKGKNGEPYFVLLAANKEVIGRSEMYAANKGVTKGIASVMRNAKARVVEL
ncbi:MAG: YegP family protein [Bacteroidota bacterium]